MEFFKKILPVRAKRSQVFAAATAALLINAVGAFFQLGQHLVVARYAGAETYGHYCIIMSWVVILVLFVVRGRDSLVLRFGAQYASDHAGRSRLLLRDSQKSVVIGWLVLAVVGFGLIGFRGDWGLLTWWSLIVGIVLVASINAIRQAMLRAYKKVSAARIPEVIVIPISLIAFVVATGEGLLTIDRLLVYFLLSVLAAFLIGNLSLNKAMQNDLKVGDGIDSDHRGWPDISRRLWLVAGLYVLVGEIDKLSLTLVADKSEAGWYAAASRLAQIIPFGLNAVNLIAAPLIAEQYARDKSKLQHTLKQVAIAITAFSVPLVMLISIFGRDLLSLFGTDFVAAHSVLLILCFGQLLTVLMGPASFLLTMTGHESWNLKVVGLVLFVQIFMSPWAALHLGINGLAMVTATSFVVVNVSLVAIARTRLKFDPSLIAIFKS